MKKEYSLEETYKTAGGEFTFQEQKRTEEEYFNRKITDYIENGKREMLTVWGLPGCGKSYLMKKIVGRLNNNTEYRDKIFAVYVDISDCTDEAEVYYRTALQLNEYYNIHSYSYSQKAKRVTEVKRLIQLYEWVKGIQRENLSVKSQSTDIVNEVAKTINDMVADRLASSDISGEEENIVYDVLLGLSEIIPFGQNVKWIIDTALNIRGLRGAYKFKKWLLEKVDILDNKTMRQNFFLNELIAAMSGVSRRMIVLDNFQMDPHNELGRDHTWLTTSGKMLARMEAFWIVVSRMNTIELFSPLFDKTCNDMELTGFTREMAEKYLYENCFNRCMEYDSIPTEDASENAQLISKMLEICDFNNKETKETYLPYLLRLVVLYYWNIREDPTITMKPELFARLNEQDDFVGFYFYKDLSDLMVNAFQILSCLSVWDHDWIQKVREKFDNHLLNARNLLEHKAPIENLGHDSFKLHEALKDGLYKNRQNYIKKDVLEHLFDSFVNIYGNKKPSMEDKSIWYEQKKIETFIEVVFEYVNLEDERENRKENLNKIRPAMNNIYKDNCTRGSVSSAFIRTYCRYIDKLGEVMGISFVKMYNNSFENNELPQNMEVSIPNREKQRQMIYYMECCFKLADLYTNMTQNGTAWRLEELCIHFWENQMEQIEQAYADYQNQVWYYRCWQQKVKAINSTAYDHSAEHQYETAYKLGSEGLDSAYRLGMELLKHIEIEKEKKEVLGLLLAPDTSEEFSVEKAYIEIPPELYEKMTNAYKSLREKCKEHEYQKASDDSFAQVMYDLMVTEQQKLRGNYPWYCIHNPELLNENTVSEKEKRKKACEYGVRTYWMRRALAESTKNTSFVGSMLTSYHNICVYLSKCGEYEEACLLEKEVLEETLQKINRNELNEKTRMFLKEISKFTETDLQKILWQREGLDDSKGEGFFSQADAATEQMQYLGDYYLKLEYYSLAQKWLSRVMLIRSVTLGEMDGKTLDTVIRFYVVLYANQKKEEEKTLLESLQKYIEEKILHSDEYISEWENEEISKGLQDKFMTLKEIITIGDKGIEDKNQQEALLHMMVKLDL
ncbi:MAG: hypothetical protein HFH67_15275 [Lachnospiraceae bacterium]|nr:hypothetical protein [Lachnospiraceae bacterium]